MDGGGWWAVRQLDGWWAVRQLARAGGYAIGFCCVYQKHQQAGTLGRCTVGRHTVARRTVALSRWTMRALVWNSRSLVQTVAPPRALALAVAVPEELWLQAVDLSKSSGCGFTQEL
eukprot:364550-Chlamydomonas_euryale.AAC.9